MVDEIRRKYRKDNYESAFNEFNDTKVIEKSSCKPCIIILKNTLIMKYSKLLKVSIVLLII